MHCIQHSRFTKQDGWRLLDLSLSLCGNIAVTGYNKNTHRTSLDVYSPVRNSDSRDKPKILYSKEFDKYQTKMGIHLTRRVSFVDDEVLVCCHGNKLEVLQVSKDEVLRSRRVNGLATCLSVREREIFIGFFKSNKITVYDVADLKEIKSVILQGFQDDYRPYDMAVITERIFVSVGDGKEESDRRSLIFDEKDGTILSELTKPTYTRWYVGSVTVCVPLGVVAVVWYDSYRYTNETRYQIVFYSLFSPNNSSFLIVEIESGVRVSRIRISDKGDRMILTDRGTGEVKVYDMADLFTFGHLKKCLASQLQGDDCRRLAEFFGLPREQSDVILKGDTPADNLLHALEKDGVIHPSKVDRLTEASGINPFCYDIIVIYQNTRRQLSLPGLSTSQVIPQQTQGSEKRRSDALLPSTYETAEVRKRARVTVSNNFLDQSTLNMNLTEVNASSSLASSRISQQTEAIPHMRSSGQNPPLTSPQSEERSRSPNSVWRSVDELLASANTSKQTGTCTLQPLPQHTTELSLQPFTPENICLNQSIQIMVPPALVGATFETNALNCSPFGSTSTQGSQFFVHPTDRNRQPQVPTDQNHQLVPRREMTAPQNTQTPSMDQCENVLRDQHRQRRISIVPSQLQYRSQSIISLQSLNDIATQSPSEENNQSVISREMHHIPEYEALVIPSPLQISDSTDQQDVDQSPPTTERNVIHYLEGHVIEEPNTYAENPHQINIADEQEEGQSEVSGESRIEGRTEEINRSHRASGTHQSTYSEESNETRQSVDAYSMEAIPVVSEIIASVMRQLNPVIDGKMDELKHLYSSSFRQVCRQPETSSQVHKPVTSLGNYQQPGTSTESGQPGTSSEHPSLMTSEQLQPSIFSKHFRPGTSSEHRNCGTSEYLYPCTSSEHLRPGISSENTTHTSPQHCEEGLTYWNSLEEHEKLRLRAFRDKPDDRKKLVRRLVEIIFTEEERKTQNCFGKSGFPQLNEEKLMKVRKITFYLCPVRTKATDRRKVENKKWTKLCGAIDAANRRFRKKLKRQERKDSSA